MNKTILKRLIISILIIGIMSSLFISLSSLAGGDFPMFEEGGSVNDDINNKATELATTAVLAVRIITFAIAIVILLVIAMKYMISAPNDRADIKKHAVPYVIGVLILFGTSGILTLIQKLSTVFDE